VDCSSHENDCQKAADFITSGNIDRYAIRTGGVRFLGRIYQRPTLPLDSPEITPQRRRLFAGQKILIAGLSRRLEAAVDNTGLALGVQVFAVCQWSIDPYYLLALLNSKLLSYHFATRFAGKRLAGDYLAINKGQLAQLPIRIVKGSGERHRMNRLSALAQRRTNQPHVASDILDAEIDALVYQLYGLTASHVEQVEAHFREPAARAA
jgi:hypothetical protein